MDTQVDEILDELDEAYGRVEETRWMFCEECCECIPVEEFDQAEQMCKKCAKKLEGEWLKC